MICVLVLTCVETCGLSESVDSEEFNGFRDIDFLRIVGLFAYDHSWWGVLRPA